MVSPFLETREMDKTGNTTTSTGRNIFLTRILLLAQNLLNVRFVDRDMLLRYHWGHGIGHVYSHVTRAGAASNNSTVSMPANPDVSSPDPADVELNIDTGDEVGALEDWTDSDIGSNDTESDNHHDEGLNSDFSSEGDLTASLLDSESVHPGIDNLEFDDYRY